MRLACKKTFYIVSNTKRFKKYINISKEIFDNKKWYDILSDHLDFLFFEIENELGIKDFYFQTFSNDSYIFVKHK